MEETKDDKYLSGGPVPGSNSSGNSPSYAGSVDTESHREETSTGDSAALVVQENKDPSVALQNISESINNAKIVNDPPSYTDHLDPESHTSHREETSTGDSAALVVQENKDPSVALQNISESINNAKIVNDSPSYTDHVDPESHRKEISIEDHVASVVKESKDPSIGLKNILKSVDDNKIDSDSPSYTDNAKTESQRKETSVEDSVESVVQENKNPSTELNTISESTDDAKIVKHAPMHTDDTEIEALRREMAEEDSTVSVAQETNDQSAVSTISEPGDAKIDNDGTGSVHTGSKHLETSNAENNILLDKPENGVSVAKQDIKKSGYTDDKKTFRDGSLSVAKPPAGVKAVKEYRGLVDTAAPFESVKEAVTKFGGIVDWKAHKSQILERRRLVQLELEKVKQEIPLYKEQSEAAEITKADILKELDGTKRYIEELKLALEKVQTEESQAKQDLELVQLRVKEIDQGIDGEASVAAKAQVDVVKARYTAAVAELKSVKNELNSMQEQLDYLINEKNNAIKRAEEAVNASRDIEKNVEDFTMELLTAREALESAHASHMEAEEHRIGAVLARDQDVLNWEKELKQAECELQLMNEKLLSVKELQSKLATASTLLLNLKAELAAYMEVKLSHESEDAERGKVKNDNEVTTHASIQEAVASIKRETEDVNSNIEKAKEEAKCLNTAVASLKSELEAEQVVINTTRQREGMASIAVQSLEAELKRIRKEIEVVQAKERETKDELVKLPEVLQKASWEADEAKLVTQTAFEELRKAKEEAERVKASASTIQSRLTASLKEIEAAKASEKIANSAIKALQESEQTATIDLDADVRVTIPLEEYYALSKRAYEAEEHANQKVSAAISQIQVAKVSESQALEKLADANRELDAKKAALRLAREKAENATQGKLGVEQELRKWRADHERRRKATETSRVVNPSRSPERSVEKEPESELGKAYVTQATPSGMVSFPENSPGSDASEGTSRKKKSIFPRFVRFLVRKKQTVD